MKEEGQQTHSGLNIPTTIPVIDLEKTADAHTNIPRYVANGLDIDGHDIKSLNAGVMMNDKIVKVLMR